MKLMMRLEDGGKNLVLVDETGKEWRALGRRNNASVVAVMKVMAAYLPLDTVVELYYPKATHPTFVSPTTIGGWLKVAGSLSPEDVADAAA